MEILELARKKLVYLTKRESQFSDKTEYRNKIAFLESILKMDEQTSQQDIARSCVVLMPFKEEDPFGSYRIYL